jgi:hypothetical protein
MAHSLEKTRDQLLLRLSRAHQHIKRSRRESLADHGQSFENDNVERLHQVIVKHATARICRVIRSAVRASLNRRLQRSMYRLQCHAVAKNMSEKARTIIKWKDRVHEMRRESLRHQIHQLQAEKNTIIEQRTSMEDAVQNIQSQVNNSYLKEATSMTLSRLYVRHILIRKYRLEQKWAMKKWYLNTSRMARIHNMMRRWSTRTLRRWFHIWYQSEHLLERDRRTLHNIYRRVALRRITHAFDIWYNHVNYLQNHRLLVSKRRLSTQRKAMNTWKIRYAYQQQLHSKLNRAWRIWSQRRMFSSFRQWRIKIKKQQQLKRTILHYQNVVFKRTIYHCLSKWRIYVHAQRVQRAAILSDRRRGLLVLSKIYQRYITRLLQKNIDRWHHIIVKERVLKHQLHRLLKRRHNLIKRKVYDEWHMCSQENKTSRIRLQRFVNRWQNYVLHASLNGWNYYVKQRKKQKRMMLNFIVRHKYQIELYCYHTWKNYSYKRAHARLLLLRMSVIVTNRSKRHTFHQCISKWSRHINHQREQSRAAAEVKQHLHARTLVLSRLLRRQKDVLSRSAMKTWTKVHAESIVNDRQMKRVAKMWNARQLVYAFDGWCVCIAHSKRVRRIRTSALRRIRTGRLSQAFTTWWTSSDVTTQCRRMLTTILHRTRNRIVKQMLRRWNRQSVALVLRETYQLQSVKVIYNVLHRLRRSRLSTTLHHWYIQCQEIRRQHHIVQKTAKILHRRKQYAAFHGWCQSTHNSILTRQRLHRVIQRMRHQKMSLSYRTWFQYYQLRSRARSIMRTLLNRYSCWRKERLRLSIMKWDKSTMAKVHKESLMIIKLQHLQSIVLNSVRRKEEHALRSAISQWCMYTTEKIRKEELSDKVIQSWTHAITRRVMNTWWGFTQETMEMRLQLIKVTSRMKKSAMTKVWNTWLSKAQKRKYLKAFLLRRAKTKHKHCLGTYLKQWYRNAMKVSWHLKNVQRGLCTLRKVYHHHEKLMLLRSCTLWSMKISQLIKKEKQIKKAVSLWIKLQLSRSLRKWVHVRHTSHRLRNLYTRAVSRLRHVTLDNCWSKWHHYQEDRNQLRRVCKQWIDNVNAFHFRKMTFFFARWSSMARYDSRLSFLTMSHTHDARRILLLRNVYQKMKNIRRDQMSKTLHYWRTQTARIYLHSLQKREGIKLLCRHISYHIRRIVHQGYFRWVAFCRYQQHVEHVLHTLQSNSKQIIKNMYFRNWQKYTTEKIQRKKQYFQMLRNATRKRECHAMQQWTMYTQQATRSRNCFKAILHRRFLESTAKKEERMRETFSKMVYNVYFSRVHELIITQSSEKLQYKNKALHHIVKKRWIRSFYLQSFEKWYTVVHEMKMRQKQRMKVLLWYRHKCSMKYFVSWKKCSISETRKRKNILWLVVRRRSRDLHQCWTKWKDWHYHWKNLCLLLRHIVSMKLNTHRTMLRECISKWKNNMKHEDHTQNCYRNGLHYLSHIMCRNYVNRKKYGFVQWKRSTQNQFRLDRMSATLCQHWKYRRMKFTFENWKEWKVGVRLRQQHYKKIVHQVLHHLLFECFQQWKDWTTNRFMMLRRLKTCVKYYQQCCQFILRKTMVLWYKNMLNERLIKRERNFAETSIIENASLGLKRFTMVVQRQNRAWLHAGFKQWYSNHLYHLHLDRRMYRFIKNFSQRQLYKSFNRWCWMTNKIVEKKILYRRVYARVTKKLKCTIFIMWKENVNNILLQQKTISRTMQKILNRIVTHRLRNSISLWKYNCEKISLSINRKNEREEFQQSMLKRQLHAIVAMMLRKRRVELRQGWTWWCSQTAKMKLQSMLLHVRHVHVLKLLDDKQCSYVRRVLRQWSSLVLLKKHRSKSLLQMLSGSRKRMKRQVFKQLINHSFYVSEQTRATKEQTILKSTINDMTTAHKHKMIEAKEHALLEYKDMINHFSEEKEALKERIAKQRLMTVSLRIKSRKLATSFASWTFFLLECKQAKTKMMRACRFLQRRVTSKVFTTWTMYWSHHRRYRKYLFRIQQRNLSSVFKRWSEFQTLQIEARATAKKVARKLVKRIISRMVFKILGTAFSFWSNHSKYTAEQERDKNRQDRRMKLIMQRIMHHQMSNAFYHLVKHVKTRKQTRSYVKRWLRRRMCSSFVDLRVAVNIQLENKRKLRLVFGRVFNRLTYAMLFVGFSSWISCIKLKKSIEWKLERATRLIIHRTISRAFNSWQKISTENIIEKRKLQRYLIKMQLRHKRYAIAGWMSFHESRVQVRRIMARIVARVQSKKLASAIFTWHQQTTSNYYIEHLSFAQERSIHHVLARLKHRRKLSTFMSWIHLAQIRKKARVVIARATTKIQFKYMHQAWFTWKVHITYLQHKEQINTYNRRRIKNVVGRMNSRLLSKAYAKWVSEVRSSKRIRKYMTRWLSKRVASAFDGWCSFVDMQVSTRCTMLRVTNKMTRVLLGRGMTTWIHFHRHTSKLNEENKEQETRMRRSIKWMSHRVLSKALLSWTSFLYLRRRLRKYASRMQQREMLAVFNRWNIFLNERASLRRLVGRVMHRWMSHRLAMGFATWSKHHQDSCAQEKVQVIQTRRMYHVLARLNNRMISKCYDQWYESVKQIQKFRAMLHRTLDRQKYSAFMKWLAFVGETCRLRQHLKKTLSRLQRVLLLRGFTTWLHVSKEIGHVKLAELLADQAAKTRQTRALIRLRHRQLLHAFDIWHDVIADLVRVRTILISLVRCCRTKMLTIGWKAWLRQDLQERLYLLDSDANSALEQQKLQIKRMLLRRVITRCCLHRGSRAAFDIWRSTSLRLASLFRIRLTIQRRWIYGTLSSSFDGWRDHACSMQRQRDLIRRCTFKMSQRLLHRSFAKWDGETAARKRDRIIIVRTSLKMTHRTTARSFQSWCWFVKERLSQKRTMNRIMIKLWNRRLSSAYRTWHAVCREHKTRARHQRNIQQGLYRLALRIKRRQLSHVYSELKDAMYKRRALARVVLRMQHRLLSAGYQGWRIATEKNKRARHLMQQALKKWSLRVMARALTSLAWHAEERVHCREIFLRLLRTLQQRSQDYQRMHVRTAWKQWQSFTECSRLVDAEVKMQEALNQYTAEKKARDISMLHRVLSRMQQHAVTRSFTTWSHYVHVTKINERRLRHAQQYWTQLLLSRAFRTWNKMFLERCRCRRLMRRMVSKWMLELLRKGMQSWIVYVRDTHHQEQMTTLHEQQELQNQQFHQATAAFHTAANDFRRYKQVQKIKNGVIILHQFLSLRLDHRIYQCFYHLKHIAMVHKQKTDQQHYILRQILYSLTLHTQQHQQQLVRQAYTRWTTMTHTLQKRMNKKIRIRAWAKRLLFRRTNRTRSTIFQAWHTAARTAARTFARNDAEKQHQKRRVLALVQRNSTKNRKSVLSKIFTTWCGFIRILRSSVLQERRIRRYFMHMARRSQAKVFEHWRSETEQQLQQQQRNREVVARCVVRMHREVERTAFNKWFRTVTHLSLQEDAHVLSKATQDFHTAADEFRLFRRKMLLERCIQRIQQYWKTRVTGAYTEWIIFVAQRRQTQQHQARQQWQQWQHTLQYQLRFVSSLLCFSFSHFLLSFISF